MKNIYLIIIISLFSLTSHSQTKEISRIKILSVGNDNILNGSCKITIDNITTDDKYYVILTPLNQYAELYITDKKDNSFTVKSKTNDDIKFDYIIVLKRTKQKIKSLSSEKKEIINSNNEEK